jgi:hypothetical protein
MIFILSLIGINKHLRSLARIMIGEYSLYHKESVDGVPPVGSGVAIKKWTIK